MFNQIYLETSKDREAIKESFNQSNYTPEALNELTTAANFIRNAKIKLTMAGIALHVKLGYDYKMRIVFIIDELYQAGSGQKCDQYCLTDCEKSFLSSFRVSVPRISYNDKFVEAFGNENIKTFIPDEFGLILEYCSQRDTLVHLKLLRNFMYKLCKEFYVNNKNISNIWVECSKPLPYSELVELYNILNDYTIRVLRHEISTKESFYINVGFVIEQLQASKSKKDVTGIVKRYRNAYGEYGATDIMELFRHVLWCKVYVCEIVPNMLIQKKMDKLKSKTETTTLLSYIGDDVDKNVIRPYTKSIGVTESTIGSQEDFVFKQYKLTSKQRLCELYLRALEMLSNKPISNIKDSSEKQLGISVELNQDTFKDFLRLNESFCKNIYH
jgi:hypothetical protein